MKYRLKPIQCSLIVAAVVVLLSASCGLTRKVNEKNYYQKILPPNGVKIGENLYCDKTEITNLSWREYMHWNRYIFGSRSEEFVSTLPDTAVWYEFDSCLGYFMWSYLHLPAFEDYPVVGISYKQAVAYSQWRSDRVFEYILHKYNKIDYDRRQSRKTHFTAERYFKGELSRKPDPDFRFYPVFRLPTEAEWKNMIKYSDSVEQSYLENCSTPACKTISVVWPEFHSDVVPCIHDTIFVIPTSKVNTGFMPDKYHPVFNLRGNVSELSADSGISRGGGWIHKRGRILINDTFHVSKPDCYTGFRNVCSWKEYKAK